MDLQNAANWTIPEGGVRNLHDKDKRLLWSAIGYDVKYKGDTTQQTYSGKNLMPVSEAVLNDDARLVRFLLSFPAGTYRMTFVVDSFSLGTNSHFDLYSQIYTAGGYVDVNITRNSGHITSSTVPGQKFSYKIIFNDDVTTAQYCNIRIPQTTYDNGARVSISQIQIEAGSTATDYEPYVGGIPAPNPDYPQDVNVVKGAQTIRINSKNWTPYPYDGTGNGRGITFSADSRGVVTLNGQNDNTGQSQFFVYDYHRHSDKPYIIPAGTYYLIKPSNNNVSLTFYDGVTYRTLRANSDSMTLAKDTGFIQIYSTVSKGNTTVFSDFKLYPMLSAMPNLADDDFEPYQGQTFPVDLGSIELCKIGNYQDYIAKSSGKNIWGGYTAFHKEANGMTFDTAVDGFITAIGTATGTAYSILGSEAASNGTYITLQAGTYRLSVDGTLPSGVGIQVVDTSGSVISSSTGSFTLSATTNVAARLRVESGTAITNGITVYPMLSVGSSSIPYEPYGTDWYVYKEIIKTVLNGTESVWASFSLSGGTYYYYRNDNLWINAPSGNISPLFCDYYKATSFTDGTTLTSVDNSAFFHNSGIKYIAFKNSAISSLDDFKTWLGTHNTTVYSPLITPTYTKITDATLISQLDAIHDWLRRYDYYGVVSGNLPIIIDRTGII